jgi:hypothetical protein
VSVRTLAVLVAALALGSGLAPSGGLAASLNTHTAALTVYRTCTVTATPVTTSAVIDAVVEEDQPDANFGSLAAMDVNSQHNHNHRMYVRFDLAGCHPAIPASAAIVVATLRLYITNLPSGCRTLDIFSVTSAWTEMDITWDNQPFGTAVSNPPGASRTGSFDVGTSSSCENRGAGYVSGGTVTADVASFVSGATNRGWMIRDDQEDASPPRTATFATKDAGTLQLVVTYITAQ